MLPNGSNGDVSFTEVPCEALAGDPELRHRGRTWRATSRALTSKPLYSIDDPAAVDWTCPADECLRDRRPVYGSFDQDQEVDFENYRIQVSLLVNGEYTEFADAEPCNPIVERPAQASSPGRSPTTTPRRRASASTSTRSAVPTAFGGDLTIPVLFVEDPKLRGI